MGAHKGLPAVFTSRCINPHVVGFAEVDYIAASIHLPPETFALISNCPSWYDPDYPDSGTHIPVLICVEVPAATSPPIINTVRTKKPFVVPPYSDFGWHKLCDRITEGLPAAHSAIMSPAATPTSMYIALRDLYRSAAVAQFGTAAERTRTYRHRLYRGAPLPMPLVAMFASSRKIRQQACRAGNPQRKQMLHDQAHTISKAANSLAASYVRRFLEQLVRNVENERCVDPHNMHAHFRLLEGTDSTRSIDSSRIPVGPAGTDPPVLFHTVFSAVSTETDPLPQAVNLPQFINVVPQNAPADELLRRFSAESVYWFMFPATKRHAYVPCHHECKICAQFISRLASWNPQDPDSTAPTHSPSLRMGRSAGPDDLVAEFIRFVRPEDYSSRYDYRMAVCAIIAVWFNEMLASGCVPDGDFAKCVTTPILKAVKPGQPVPPLWPPKSYRGITNGNMLAKLFSVALSMRMAHWAVRIGLLGPEQVAFLPFHGTEEHVFSLLQVARARARDGLSTHALFVDFSQAYDMVHQEALWAVLLRMGVPVMLLNLLRDWASKRRTRVRVNGVLSAEYSMAKGVPQGDPLSCLLFSLFIESLSRYLKSRPDISGVSAFGDQIRLLLLLYADDLVVLANTSEELQRALSHIKAWSDAWRMQVNDGAGKTECLLMSVASPRPANPAPLMLAPGQPVHYVESYKYLGYIVRNDLRDDDATARLKEHMEFMWNAKFVHSGIVRRASPTFQLQYFACLVQGALQYLRSLTVCSSNLAASLEVCLSGYHKEIFRMPDKSPSELVAATARLPPWHAVHAQHHERLFQQLLHTPFQQSIAARIFRLARLDPRRGASIATRNWVACWELERNEWFARGVPIPSANLPYHRIAETAAEFARASAFWKWQYRGRVDNGIRDNDDTFDPMMRPSWRPKLAAAALYEGFQVPMSALGSHPRRTPISVHGPMCQGSLLSMSTIPAHKIAVIGHLRLGAKALQMKVFARGPKAYGHRDSGGEENPDPRNPYAIRCEPCPLCNREPLDVYHLVCECSDATISTWRKSLQTEARHLLIRIAQLLEVAHSEANRDISDICDLVSREATVLNVTTDAGQFIIYRLLLMHTWSARIPGDDLVMYPVAVVGKLFDCNGLPNRLLRPLANTWGHWSIRWSWRLGNAWRAACTLRGVPVF